LRRSLATTLAVFAGAVALLNPLREFPLDDDWAYFLDVRHALERGFLRVGDWASPTLVAHIRWGALFARAFGLSHVALRLSTLTLAALALVAFDGLADDGTPDEGKPREPAPLSPSFLLLANPLFFLLSLTFMTDVPYLAWSLVALWLYAKAEETDRDALWFAGSAVAGWAYLIRQLGALLPLAAILALLLRRRLTARRAALILLVPALTVAAHRWWFLHVNGETWAYANYVSGGTFARLTRPAVFLRDAYARGAGLLLEFSLFTFPYLAAVNLAKGPRLPRPATALFVLIAFLPALCLSGGFPYFPDVITRAGLGAPALSGMELKAAGVLGAPWFLRTMTALSLLGALGWGARLDELRAAAADPVVRLVGLAGVLQLGASLLGGGFFDRYALPALPAVLLVARRASGDATRARAGRWAAALGGLFLLWSTCGTWDYLNWKGAAWDAATAAVERGVPAERLDGGIEWLGLHDYESRMAELKARKPLADIGGWEWVDLKPLKAFVTFCPRTVGDRQVILSVPYRTPLSLETQYVYVQARVRSAP
jgi:4-amino-4-deoxy-L-arabinose transferase-like glycosyltransferase